MLPYSGEPARGRLARLARSGQRVTGCVLDVLGAVVDVVVLVPPAPIGEEIGRASCRERVSSVV